MEKNYIEDYTVGEKLITPGRTITEADVVMFAALTGDWNPIHTDVEIAKKSPFGERIAHGPLTLCVGMSLLLRLGPYVGMPKSFIAFYGYDSVRFTYPVKIGDTIHTECEIEALEMKDDKRGIIVAKNTIKNQRGETVVVCITRAMAGRKPQN